MRQRRSKRLENFRPLHPTNLTMSEPRKRTMALKPVRARRLRENMWVVVADGSEPLVVGESIAHALQSQDNFSFTPESLASTLSDAGFMFDGSTEVLPPPAPPLSMGWKLSRAALWTIGAILCIDTIALLARDGVPTGSDIVSAGPHPLLVIGIALAMAIATAIPHELAHVGFGRRIGNTRKAVQVHLLQAAATTDLTHVWTWPLSPRLSAVAAGVVVDLAFLTMALTWHSSSDSWVATIAVGVMIIRILWQFRFHRNCDGRHFAKMLVDLPTIDDDSREILKVRSWKSMPRMAWLWLLLLTVGVLVEIALLIVWLIPAVLRLFGLL